MNDDSKSKRSLIVHSPWNSDQNKVIYDIHNVRFRCNVSISSFSSTGDQVLTEHGPALKVSATTAPRNCTAATTYSMDLMNW